MSFNMTLYRNANQSNRLNGAYPNGDEPAGGGSGGEVALTLSVTGAGRIGFYMQQSELSTTGTHVFYVQRTHGTSGAVGVSYQSSGDTHTTTSGTLSWADGEADIKAVQVPVPTKSANGDHRIILTLSSPTGGAVLHQGTDTIAMGVIDDGTIATSNAIFIDAYAGTDGSGTEGSPYNNWTSVRNNLASSTRYVYIKNYLNPSETGSGATAPSGTGDGYHFEVKGTTVATTQRASEADRLYIRNWPGFEGGIDGTKDRSGNTITQATNGGGFKCDDDADDICEYVTFRGLTLKNIHTTGLANTKAYGIRIKANSGNLHERIGVERCTFDGMTASATSSTAAVYGECQSGGSGHYVWACNFDNQLNDGGVDKQWGVEYFGGIHIVNQKNTFNRCAGIYEKETPTAAQVGYQNSFNHLIEGSLRTGSQGSNQYSDYHITQSNLLDNNVTYDSVSPIHYDNDNALGDVDGLWATGNVIYSPQTLSNRGAFDFRRTVNNVVMFNNIIQDHRVMTRYDQVSNESEYQNYNCYYQDTDTGTMFEYNATNYANLAAHVSGTTFDDNSIDTDPQFTNPATDDFTLGGSSPCAGTGLSGTDMGLYLTGDETLGHTALQTNTVV